MSGKLIDLSHTVEHGMITYQGLPGPMISDHLSREASRKHYSPGTEFHIGKIEMVANTGTYVDSPFHRFSDGYDLSELPLESLANLPGILIPASDIIGPRITQAVFEGLDLNARAVLIHTGWARHWGNERYFHGHPFLSGEAAVYLVEAGASLVGIDSYNIDDTQDGSRPAHTRLLEAGIPICEHLCNLESLPSHGFRFHAVPAKVKAFGTFPVRAYACLE
jgi:kynurenine formamidase